MTENSSRALATVRSSYENWSVLYPFLLNDGDRTLILTPLNALSDSRKLLLQAELYSSKPAVTVGAFVGSEAICGGYPLLLGSITSLSPADVRAALDTVTPFGILSNETLQLSSAWRLDFGYSGEISLPSTELIPVDRNGLPIRYVDANGRPVSEKTFQHAKQVDKYGFTSLRIIPNRSSPDTEATQEKPLEQSLGNTRRNKYFVAWCRQAGPTVPGAFAVCTNINPRRMHGIQIRIGYVEIKDIGPYPLDPTLSK